MLIAKGDNCFMNLSRQKFAKNILVVFIVVGDGCNPTFLPLPPKLDSPLNKSEIGKKKKAKDEADKKNHFSKTLIMENFPRNTHTQKKNRRPSLPLFSSKNYISKT